MLDDSRIGEKAVVDDASSGDVNYHPEDLEKFLAGKMTEKQLKASHETRVGEAEKRAVAFGHAPAPVGKAKASKEAKTSKVDSLAKARAARAAKASKAADKANSQVVKPAQTKQDAANSQTLAGEAAKAGE